MQITHSISAGENGLSKYTQQFPKVGVHIVKPKNLTTRINATFVITNQYKTPSQQGIATVIYH